MKTLTSSAHPDFELLRPLGYEQPPQSVVGRSSIADMFRPKGGGRCGIYVLHFRNAEIYAGQSIDVTRRFLDHRRRWDDIVAISFRVVPASQLDYAEKEHVIPALEPTRRLRNRDEVSFLELPDGACDIDCEIPREEQDRWLAGSTDSFDTTLQRPALEEQRQRNRGLFDRFQARPQSAVALQILRAYLRAGILAPHRTEYVYWSLTCLTQGWYARLNINWQEVFAVGMWKGSDRLVVIFQLAESPLDGRVRGELQLKYPSLAFIDHWYRPGGRDQVRAQVDGEDAVAFMNEAAVLKAIRRMNLHLMRKGASVNRNSHCLDLADAVFGGQPLSALIPPPTLTSSAANEHHNVKLRELHEAALTGDSAVVNSVETQPHAKNGYSQRAHRYKQALLTALSSCAAPPSPARKQDDHAEIPATAPEIPPTPLKVVKHTPERPQPIVASSAMLEPTPPAKDSKDRISDQMGTGRPKTRSLLGPVQGAASTTAKPQVGRTAGAAGDLPSQTKELKQLRRKFVIWLTQSQKATPEVFGPLLACLMPQDEGYWVEVLRARKSPPGLTTEALRQSYRAKLTESAGQRMQSLNRAFALIVEVGDWREPRVGASDSDLASARGRQWRLAAAWAGIELLSDTFCPRDFLAPGKDFQAAWCVRLGMEELPVPIPVPGFFLKQRRLEDFWSEETALKDFLAVRTGRAWSAVEKWWLQQQPVTSMSWLMNATRCVRDLTMHGLLSASRSVEFGLTRERRQQVSVFDQMLLHMVRLACATLRHILTTAVAARPAILAAKPSATKTLIGSGQSESKNSAVVAP